jgi:hypothetical protein
MAALRSAALLLALLGAEARVAKYNTTSRRLRGVINVHLVPHTHDDVGWLKTVDQYHYGNRNDIQRAGTQNIINAVVKELAWNPDRRFIYVEQGAPARARALRSYCVREARQRSSYPNPRVPSRTQPSSSAGGTNRMIRCRPW